jgi:hypothetical protein
MHAEDDRAAPIATGPITSADTPLAMSRSGPVRVTCAPATLTSMRSSTCASEVVTVVAAIAGTRFAIGPAITSRPLSMMIASSTLCATSASR